MHAEALHAVEITFDQTNKFSIEKFGFLYGFMTYKLIVSETIIITRYCIGLPELLLLRLNDNILQ